MAGRQPSENGRSEHNNRFSLAGIQTRPTENQTQPKIQMNTLTQNELATISGGFAPLNGWEHAPIDTWTLQLTMDRLAREQESAFLRGMMQQAD